MLLLAGSSPSFQICADTEILRVNSQFRSVNEIFSYFHEFSGRNCIRNQKIASTINESRFVRKISADSQPDNDGWDVGIINWQRVLLEHHHGIY
jgi:hypothetical protein